MFRPTFLAAALLLQATASADPAFYKNPQSIFSTQPSEQGLKTNLARFGPVGMGIDLLQPAFTMRIASIEEGSPAAKTGELKKGHYIASINGEPLKDIDPRVQMANWIGKAEASDGKLVFQVSDQPGGTTRDVVVTIPVLGTYSDTWPLDCPKSEKIIRNFADYLKTEDSHKGFADIGMLFLLSTGDADDLAYVGEWARQHKGEATYPWHIGYGGLALCEYYLRTGDKAVMPAIQKMADHAASTETFGGWAGRGPLAAVTYGGGGGHLNAAGTLVGAYLLLAKECGATVPEDTLLRVLRHFYRFAGRGVNPYGNNRPEDTFVDNGKNGLIAYTMAAAASLTPDGENSVYAKARDAAAMTSFYTTGHMLHGHTGGGIGEIWRSAAMGLLHERFPAKYRDFMDQRQFHYELSRRFDGSFAILGGARYDNPEWGAGYALTYTVPRKTLRLTGAPPSKFSKPHQLPEQIWGTQADNAFLSLEPAVMPDGKKPDISGETLLDSGKPAIDRLNAMERIPDELLISYAHHPDFLMRQLATDNIMGFEPTYMFKKSGDPVRPNLIDPMLASADPRVRNAMLKSLALACKNGATEEMLTRERFDTTMAMIADPEEAWTVKDTAMQLLAYAPVEWIEPHLDLLLSFLESDEWWLQNAAMTAMTQAIADKRTYRKVLPPVGKFITTCPLWNAVAPIRWGAMPANLRKADPEVQEYARGTLKESFTNYVDVDHMPDHVNIQVNRKNREYMAELIAGMDGGFDVLYQLAIKTYPEQTLPYKDIFLEAEPEDFGPELRGVIRRTVLEELIPEYVEKHRKRLTEEFENQHIPTRPHQNSLANTATEGLVSLYSKAGIRGHDWQDFGPKPAEITWNYHSFEPKEKLLWTEDNTRYREVTFPKGMENWFHADFNPAAAGWKTGKAPFGEYNGTKDVLFYPDCDLDYCRCHVPIKTLWENEVLLLNGKIKVPEFKSGHRYRLLVGGMAHVGHGEGYRIYANGKLLAERNRGVGRREGSQPIGEFIDQRFWEDFSGQEVNLAVISFQKLRRGVKYRHMSIWLQEMKLPPLPK